jgi:signal transduction histidine kinase
MIDSDGGQNGFTSQADLDSLMQMVAHDLRSPLGTGLTLLQLAVRRAKGSLAPDELALLERAESNFRRLDTLIQDLSDFWLVVRGVPIPEAVSLDEPLQEALRRLQKRIGDTSATVVAGSLPVATVDRSRMALVFRHLIDNAIRFRRDIPPRIGIETSFDGDHWLIAVRDNGQGFHPQYAAQIFEPLKRLHTSDVAGSGLGLAVCKTIVEGWGGRIWAESTPGLGSTVYLTLPA